MAAPSKLCFRTLGGSWGAGEHGDFNDSVELTDPPAELVRLAAGAHAAGVIEVTEGLDTTVVQSQADAEKANAKAQKDGSWLEGQLANVAITTLLAGKTTFSTTDMTTAKPVELDARELLVELGHEPPSEEQIAAHVEEIERDRIAAEAATEAEAAVAAFDAEELV